MKATRRKAASNLPFELGASASGSPLERRELAEGLLRIIESERAQAAELLRGDVASLMVMARYRVEQALQHFERGEFEGISGSLRSAADGLREALGQVHHLGAQLLPSILKDLGLVAALSACMREFNQQHPEIFVSSRISVAEPEIPLELKLCIYRIAQAALNNVARHSKASFARVFLSAYEGHLRLAIEDNGIGFDVARWQHLRRPHGCGLSLIMIWAENSGARYTIASEARHGTRVQVSWRLLPMSLPSTFADAVPERAQQVHRDEPAEAEAH